MTEDAKKVWEELENMGWRNEPKDYYLTYFEDVVKAAKQALTIPDVNDSFSKKDLLDLGEWFDASPEFVEEVVNDWLNAR